MRPAFPDMGADDERRHACFPPDFVTTRARVRDGRFELCGLSRGAPRCFTVDPVTTFVEAVDVADAPRAAPSQPCLEGSVTRTELITRGARVDSRGGTLSVRSPSGASRTITARTVGVSALDNAVLVPWTDGWFVAVFGVRAPDLGASALLDPGPIRMRGRAAYLPCPAAP